MEESVEEFNEDAKPLGETFDLLPLYESTKFERSSIINYSLNNNRKMACRWMEYKNKYKERNFAPFQLPNSKELHFHNNAIRYRPTSSHEDFRHKLKPGPGVDQFGQMPIPQEALMKRGTAVKAVIVKPKKAGKRNKRETKGDVLGDAK